MPRIRSIKPEFCVSDQIVECSTNARLLFILMWMFCDDRGVHPSSLTKLKMECFPADPFTEADMREWMNQLIKARLIARFLSDGLEYWHVRGWKHQKIDRPSFKYPAPEGVHFDEYSTNDRGSLVGRHPPESMGRDVDGKGVEGSSTSLRSEREVDGSFPVKPTNTNNGNITTSEDFDAFWRNYPRRVSKGDAEKAWAKIKPDQALRVRIMRTLNLLKQCEQWTRDNGQFVPYPASWLNAKGWEDEVQVDGAKPLMSKQMQGIMALERMKHGESPPPSPMVQGRDIDGIAVVVGSEPAG